MHALPSLTLISSLLLTGCVTAPNVQVIPVCPRLPEMEKLPAAALERDYSALIANFLRGSLETQISYELTSKPVTTATTQPVKP